MQINLAQHPGAFASLDEAFDPVTNVAYGGNFLQALFRQRGDWPTAIAAYHSSTPSIGADYLKRVAVQASFSGKLLVLVQAALAVERPSSPAAGRLAPADRVMPADHLAPLDQTSGFERYRQEIADDRRRNLASAGILTPQAAAGGGLRAATSGRVFAQRPTNSRSRLN